MVGKLQKTLLGGVWAVMVSLVFLLSLVLAPAEVWGQLEINKIEVNQAIGNQYKNHLNFVAGKSTVVRAFLTEAVTFSKRFKLLGLENTSATATNKTTAKSFELKPKSYDAATDVVDFYCPKVSDCGNWAAGNYEFSVTVKGVTKTTTDTYAFQERKSLKILAVPVKANYSDNVVPYPSENYKTLWKFTRDVYPIPDDGIKWITRKELDASAAEYDLNKKDGQDRPGWYALWSTLANLNPNQCTAGGSQGKDCYDLVVGFVPKSPPGAAGFTYGKPANIVTGTDEDAAATVSHEMAHCYDIGDTYGGAAATINCKLNPAPDGWVGKDWYTRKNTACWKGTQPYLLEGEGIGAKIPLSAHAYDVNNRGALGVMADFMSSSGIDSIFWITPEVYNHLFESFAPPVASARLRDGPPQRVIAYKGTIARVGNAITLEPWESYTDTADIPDSNGTFTIKAVDGEGQVLATQAVKVNFYIQSPPQYLNSAPFRGTMRFPEGTAQFQIVRTSDSSILKEITVSANPPEVADVSPSTPGVVISGQYTITWTGQDADAGGLNYKVEYNADSTNAQSEWMILATNLTATEWTEDFGQLPGGDNAVLRVTATDGILTASALSTVFSVPMKAPQVFIDELEWGSDYEYGAAILLVGEAYDLNDGWLPDDKLEWASDLSGALGSGSPLLVDSLPPGTHTITLTATNSAGLQSTDQITLRIAECTYAVSPQSLPRFKPGGGSSEIQVTASQPEGSSAVCTLTNDDLATHTDDGGDWITATVASFADNQGTVAVSLAPNHSKSVRRGKVAILGNEVEVTQKGATCKLELAIKSMEFPKEGGAGAFEVGVIHGCDIKWWANKDRTWITITSGESGHGDGTVAFSVAPNQTKVKRTGHIWVNNHQFTVTQQPNSNPTAGKPSP
jgi:hypothetical protein